MTTVWYIMGLPPREPSDVTTHADGPTVLVDDLDDPTIEQTLALVQLSGVLDFWDHEP